MAMYPTKILKRLARFPLEFVKGLGSSGVFLASTFFWTFAPPVRIRRILKQLYFIGSKSSLIVILTGGFTGMVLTLETYYGMRKFGAEALIGPTVALALIREIGPVISALMITARAGSALTAEIGIMRITEQIDALLVMAVNPIQYLIVPNLIAGLISFPLLTGLFDVVGIWGGYAVGVKLLGLTEGSFFGQMSYFVDMQEIMHGIYKSLSFALLMVWICCYKGYTASKGAEGVSDATTKAVVLTSVLILVCDYVLTSILFS